MFELGLSLSTSNRKFQISIVWTRQDYISLTHSRSLEVSSSLFGCCKRNPNSFFLVFPLLASTFKGNSAIQDGCWNSSLCVCVPGIIMEDHNGAYHSPLDTLPEIFTGKFILHLVNQNLATESPLITKEMVTCHLYFIWPCTKIKIRDILLW